MSELTQVFASVLVDRYGDMAFSVASKQTCDAGTAENLAMWISIAIAISELNRTVVVELMGAQPPSLIDIKPAT